MNGILTNSSEATRFIDRIDDPITRTLVNMAFVHFVKRAHLGDRDAPAGDVDMLYVVERLAEFFTERDVIIRTVEGERVGAWFEDPM